MERSVFMNEKESALFDLRCHAKALVKELKDSDETSGMLSCIGDIVENIQQEFNTYLLAILSEYRDED